MHILNRSWLGTWPHISSLAPWPSAGWHLSQFGKLRLKSDPSMAMALEDQGASRVEILVPSNGLNKKTTVGVVVTLSN